MKEVSAVLTEISRTNCYDGFVHYADLHHWSQETGIPPIQWDTLLESWEYDPAQSMAIHKRGNCVDFAVHTVHQLGKVGITAHCAGGMPTDYYNARQKQLLGYEHAPVIGESEDGQFICEPGWNSPAPMLIQPGLTQKLGTQIFHNKRLTADFLVQDVQNRDGNQFTRTIKLRPLEADELLKITRGAMRMPHRRMRLAATLENEPERNQILYDPKTGLLTSRVPYLPERFHPNHISNRANHKLSSAFGFDVKEELLACYAIKEALPHDFWVA